MFKCLMNDPEKEHDFHPFHQGTLYLASSLKSAGIRVVLSSSRISASANQEEFVTDRDRLDSIFRRHPDINFVGITLLESYFHQARRLIRYIKSRCDCFIALGGIMPTSHPEHVLAHIPEADIVIRGAGEQAFGAVVIALGGARPAQVLSAGQKRRLAQIEGLLFKSKDATISNGASRINRVRDLDFSPLDLSLLTKKDVSDGMAFSLSRGCSYSCFFCTSMDKGLYHAKSAQASIRLLQDYEQRLGALFKNPGKIPPEAWGVSFYDDDFLGDKERAVKILRFIKKSPLYLNFFQTGINSFFTRRPRSRRLELDKALLSNLTPAVFSPKAAPAPAVQGKRALEPRWKTDIYIGTENFSSRELKVLGKGYTLDEVCRVVHALSCNRIRQSHHVILANAFTSVGDIYENLFQIARLRRKNGPYFDILRPVTAHLQSFFSSGSYMRTMRSGFGKCLEAQHILSIPGHKEFDYPLILRDNPKDADAGSLVKVAAPLLNSASHLECLEKALVWGVHRWHELQGKGFTGRRRNLEAVLDKYHDYAKAI